MKSINASQKLASLLTGTDCLVVPGAYDALSARLVQEAGYETVYVGSYATAAAGFGLPDVGALTLDQLARHAGTIVDAVNVPVIADAEGGFFEPANIWRTVRTFEDSGVAAIHIEDHAGGKHTHLPQRLVPLDLMLHRLEAALDARRNNDFIVIARTDAIFAIQDEEEAIRRLNSFAEVGIEYFFANGATPETLRRIRRQIPGKFITINLSNVRDRSEWNGAADLVIDYGFCLQVVTKSLNEALELYRATSNADKTDALIEDAASFEGRLGYKAFTERATKYAFDRGPQERPSQANGSRTHAGSASVEKEEDNRTPAVRSEALGGRLPLVDPAALTQTQRELFDRVVVSQSGRTDVGIKVQAANGQLIGPFNAFLLRPEVGSKILDFAVASQSYSSLTDRERETVVVAVGAVWGAAYELYAHTILARKAGIQEDILKALVDGALPDELSEREKIAVRVARKLSVSHSIDDALYHEAEQAFGKQGLFDIGALIGRYHTVCALLTLFEVPVPV
ncbi:2-Methylisocitrate lyase, PEP mutase family [Burkholderia sp. D7]|nr:2-Methylisocitrate lyase, PEP mutase family [Burkholderia sp. D7]